MNNDFSILNYMPLGCFILDKNFRIMHWNDCLERWTGVESAVVQDKDIRDIVPVFKKEFYYLRLKGVFDGGPPVIFSSQLHKDLLPISGSGIKRSYILKAAPYPVSGDSNTFHAFFSVEDVSELSFVIDELKQTQGKLKKILSEREILIREVHHRVKNNLSLLAGLIYLQRDEVSDEKKLVQILDDLWQKVFLISRIHEMLYKSDDFSSITPSDYFIPLATVIVKSFTMENQSIELITDFDNFSLDIDRLINLGLIQVELMTNALKYGFSKDEKNWIRISLKLLPNGQCSYRVANSGKPLPEGFNLNERSGLGMRLFQLFSEQIHGKAEVQRNPVTQFSVTFPYDQ